MIDCNNILLITDNEDVTKLVTEKLVLLRENDKISVTNTSNVKKILANSLYKIVILHEDEDSETTLKLISQIKTVKDDCEIILLLNYTNPQLIVEAYDKGIYDYMTCEDDDFEMLIKTINCYRLQVSKEIQLRNEKFLYQLGVLDSKTNLYKEKYLKEIFLDISKDLSIQNGVFASIMLDNKIKTKVSSNRLAGAIKNSVRGNDIIATGRNGVFDLILPNIDLFGTKNLIEKIQQKMGENFPIRAGLSKIGIQSYETINKNATDSLTSAMQNDESVVCLDDNVNIQKNWLDDDDSGVNKKNFKLFKVAFTNKLTTVIAPSFFRYQKEYETKLTITEVSQYTNKVECVFCLKNDNVMSELVIRYNGYAKFYIEINHSGLDTVENFDTEIPLSSMTEKYLTMLLKRLKEEYKESNKMITNSNKEEPNA